jgi:hypothetical protein
VLFARIYDWQQWWNPYRSLEPGSFEVIREMLRELKWFLPDEDEECWGESSSPASLSQSHRD